MCEQCKNLQKQIDQFSRILQYPLDPLTEQRLKAAVAEMDKAQSRITLRPFWGHFWSVRYFPGGNRLGLGSREGLSEPSKAASASVLR